MTALSKDLPETDAERKLLAALGDPRWHYRTVDGLVKATGLPESDVLDVLRKFRNTLVHHAPLPDRNGRDLYTLATRHPQLFDTLLSMRTLIGKTAD